MTADKVLNLVDITTAGREIALADVMTTDAPLAFARAKEEAPLVLPPLQFLNRAEFASVFPQGPAQRAEPMLCFASDCFLMGPFGSVVLPSGQMLRQSLLNLDGGSIQYTLEQFKTQFPGHLIPWSFTPHIVFSANGYSTNNYFHFMIDCLAQMQWRERVPALDAAKTILTGFPAEAEARLPFMGGGAMTAAQIDARSLARSCSAVRSSFPAARLAQRLQRPRGCAHVSA